MRGSLRCGAKAKPFDFAQGRDDKGCGWATGVRCCLLLYGLATEAGGGVVVDYAGGLQEGVDDDWADEFEAALF